MPHAHPFWRGLALAAVCCLMLALLGTPALAEHLSFFRPDRPLLAFAGMAVLGAAAAALPERLRQGGFRLPRPSLKRCGTAFLGGMLMALGLGLAQAGDVALLTGMLQGGLGALAFGVCAWLTAAATVRLMGRWRR